MNDLFSKRQLLSEASQLRNEKVTMLLLEIAKKNSSEIKYRGDLERRYTDSEDFIELSVWSLKQMLIDAFEAGVNINNL